MKTTCQTKTIHVFVALCDNQFQGIVPVPTKLGNGKDPKNNLYWGAIYGVKSYFKRKSKDWVFKGVIPTRNNVIIERVLFKHAKKDIFLVADAYDGQYIKKCTEDFLRASNHQNSEAITFQNKQINIGGKANLLAYIGHDGLMDFNVDISYQKTSNLSKKDIIVLACFSQDYFSDEIKKANANPILWTTNLMAPEAYTLEAAINNWSENKPASIIKESAAKAYHAYQKCGMKGARNLFTYGFKN
ncbi:hypothetical protein [Tenacibaculum amylolyticum]|uniref:hypothetical protein n=1 Tax=Tenacibaculum amylolyticum TaxID=104269 RepID=UPI0038B69807